MMRFDAIQVAAQLRCDMSVVLHCSRFPRVRNWVFDVVRVSSLPHWSRLVVENGWIIKGSCPIYCVDYLNLEARPRDGNPLNKKERA